MSKYSASDRAELRRRYVADYRRQGMSLAQIAEQLAKDGNVNPETDQAWSKQTIKTDLDTLKQEAREYALRDTLEHRAEILEQYKAMLEKAWESLDFKNVHLALKAIREMLGTDAPQVLVFEQVTSQLQGAFERLEVEFANEPELFERAARAIMGRSLEVLPRDERGGGAKALSSAN